MASLIMLRGWIFLCFHVPLQRLIQLYFIAAIVFMRDEYILFYTGWLPLIYQQFSTDCSLKVRFTMAFSLCYWNPDRLLLSCPFLELLRCMYSFMASERTKLDQFGCLNSILVQHNDMHNWISFSLQTQISWSLLSFLVFIDSCSLFMTILPLGYQCVLVLIST